MVGPAEKKEHQDSPNKQKRKLRLIIKIELLVVALILVILAIDYYVVGRQIDTASKVSTSFVNDLKSKDIGNAYSLLSPTYLSLTSKNDLNHFASQLSSQTISSPSLNKFGQIGPFQAVHNLKIVYPTNKDGKNGNVIVYLEKDKNSWKVQAFVTNL